MMGRTRIKICGVSTIEAAEAAALAGADAIGMVFYPAARRCISRETARQIVRRLPPFVTPVGLFVNAEPAEILATVREIGLRQVQLHGHEQPEHVLALHAEGMRVIKAVPVHPQSLAEDLAPWKRLCSEHPDALSGILLETAGQGAPGGTGVANDWTFIRQAIASGAFEGLPPLVAAGGLNPQTVGDVIASIRPYAVDVSSGVETGGKKDPALIRAFIAAVHQADRASVGG